MNPIIEYVMRNPKDIEKYHICQPEDADYVVMTTESYNDFYNSTQNAKDELSQLDNTDIVALAESQTEQYIANAAARIDIFRKQRQEAENERDHYINLRAALLKQKEKATINTKEE